MDSLVGAGYGFDGVMQMPWPQARALARAYERRQAAEMVRLACATRIAGVDKKDFGRWVKDMLKA